MINTVFFDWGGVVAEDPGDDFLKEILHSCGATPEQMEQISRVYMQKFMRGEFTESDYWNAVKSHYGYDIPMSTESLFLSWHGTETNDDVMALVRDVQASGRVAGLLSNVIQPAYDALSEAGVYDPFDVVITSCTEGVAKPEPEIFQLALERTKTTAPESLFIDDKLENIEVAQQLGFKTILAENPAQFIAEARKLLDL